MSFYKNQKYFHATLKFMQRFSHESVTYVQSYFRFYNISMDLWKYCSYIAHYFLSYLRKNEFITFHIVLTYGCYRNFIHHKHTYMLLCSTHFRQSSNLKLLLSPILNIYVNFLFLFLSLNGSIRCCVSLCFINNNTMHIQKSTIDLERICPQVYETIRWY